MKRLISTLAAAVLIGLAGLLSVATSQAAAEGWGGAPVALDTDNGFAPIAFAEPGFAPAAIEEVTLKPSIGRIVHFEPTLACAEKHGPGPFAAIVTAVHSDICVNLKVLWDDDDPAERLTSVVQDQSAKPAPMTWRWPERVA